jgi:hypothetical protein
MAPARDLRLPPRDDGGAALGFGNLAAAKPPAVCASPWQERPGTLVIKPIRVNSR